MKTFHCQYCGNPVFFENVQCLRCGSALAFLPDRLAMAAIEPAPGEGGLWRPRVPAGGAASTDRYRPCHNHITRNACNFAVAAADANALCVSCRLTRVLPDLSQPGNPQRWYKLEAAKRRLFYTLARLGLLDATPADGGADGPVFEFLADLPGQPVATGHSQGVITINVVEADDAERVRRRVEMHEPYRTLLGHFRHESGHYYWDRLIAEGGRVEDFRRVFGDERQDYPQALQAHYARGGAPSGWHERFVSEYATAHPWEDWAETWAHYLHMVDLLETAAAHDARLGSPDEGDFDALVERWVPVTLLLNSLNRSLGQEDAYPFALSPGALGKLRYVHDVIGAQRLSPSPAGGRGPG